jgi:hypothetical protein
MNGKEHMTPQEQEPPLSQQESSGKEEPGIKDILKRWIQPPTFLLSTVILAELYIVIASHITNIPLLLALLIIPAIFAGIGIKDIIAMIATMQGLSRREGVEHSKDHSP